MNRVIRSTVVCLTIAAAAVGTLSAQMQTLTEQAKADAVRDGVKLKGKLSGLQLLDSAQGFLNALDTTGSASRTGFSLRVYTPASWVEQLASNAAKQYKPFAIADITKRCSNRYCASSCIRINLRS